MTIPSLDSITSFLTIFAAVFGALLAALWLSLIIWAFRDMRHRSRDPFAQILAGLLVALLPFIGIIIDLASVWLKLFVHPFFFWMHIPGGALFSAVFAVDAFLMFKQMWMKPTVKD